MTAIGFLSLVMATLLSYTFGFILTETRYTLARYRLFQFKAFMCRPCLSFHICWVLNTALSLFMDSGIMLAVGMVFSAFLYIGLKIDEKGRFV